MGLFSKNKKDDLFMIALIEEAEKTMQCVEYLEINIGKITPALIEQNQVLINDISERKRVLIDNLNNTFITPIDREDIYHISASLLALAKYGQTTLEEIYLLNVTPDSFIYAMIEDVKKETIELHKTLVHLLRNPRLSYEHIVNVTKLENRIDKTYREAVKVLFGNKTSLYKNLQDVLHRREVYRHISNMSDKADATADVLGIAVMKLS